MYEMYPDTWRVSEVRRRDAAGDTAEPRRRPRKVHTVLPLVAGPSAQPVNAVPGA